MKKQFLLFVFTLFAFTLLLSSVAGASLFPQHTITGFDTLPPEESTVSFAEDAKPSLEEIVRFFPEKLTVYLDYRTEPVLLPVTWFCAGCDYALALSNSADAFMSLPFGHVYKRVQKRMENSGAKTTIPKTAAKELVVSGG